MASRSFPVGASSFNAAASAIGPLQKTRRRTPPASSNSTPCLWFHPGRRHLRSLEARIVERLSERTGPQGLFHKLADVSKRGGPALRHGDGGGGVEKAAVQHARARNFRGQTGERLP